MQQVVGQRAAPLHLGQKLPFLLSAQIRIQLGTQTYPLESRAHIGVAPEQPIRIVIRLDLETHAAQFDPALVREEAGNGAETATQRRQHHIQRSRPGISALEAIQVTSVTVTREAGRLASPLIWSTSTSN